MNIPLVLQTIRPKAAWSLNGEEYSGLEWLDEVQTKPSFEEIEAAWVEIQSAPTPAPAPTLRSFSLACGRVLWSRIEAAVEAIPGEDAKWEAKQYLLKSPHVERNHPLVASLAAALELSSEEVDTVFAAAKLIDETL